MLLVLHGDAAKAQQLADSAVNTARSGKDPLGLARALEELAFAFSPQRKADYAAPTLKEDCALAEKAGQKMLLSKCRITAAEVALQRGDAVLARSLLASPLLAFGRDSHSGTGSHDFQLHNQIIGRGMRNRGRKALYLNELWSYRS